MTPIQGFVAPAPKVVCVPMAAGVHLIAVVARQGGMYSICNRFQSVHC